jgi:hypothetical protein
MTDTRYNGWTNRATWAVALHINNDQGAQEMVAEWASEALGDREEASVALVECLRAFVEGEIEEAAQAAGHSWGACLMRDLIEDGVNWFEIAATFVEEARR